MSNLSMSCIIYIYIYIFTGIERIAPSRARKYKTKKSTLSISINCADCKVPIQNAEEATSKSTTQTSESSSQSGEVISQSSEVLDQSNEIRHVQPSETLLHASSLNLNLPQTICQGKMYILTYVKDNESRFRYFLCVMNMDGAEQREEKLGFLESSQLVKAKIFCRRKMLILINVTGRIMFICDGEGGHLSTINVNEQLRSAYFSRPPIFTISFNGELICSEGRRPTKLRIYEMDEKNGSLRRNEKREIVSERVVKAVAVNQVLNELIILCHSSILKRYHLEIYDRNGKLKEYFRLGNGDYREAKMIFHPSGRVVLLNKHNLLHLL